MSDPLVTIWCSAFNQEKYIAQAIESFLMQETDFDLEIFVHDDASTDSTAEIIREYADRDSRIRPICLAENRFSTDKSYLNRIMFERAKGKYIAMCEGDDYWTDPLKLQKQVDFLESNPDFTICFHAVNVEYETDLKKPHLSTPVPDATATFEDLAGRKISIHTPSVVFRNGLFRELPDWFRDCPVGDYPLHLLNAEHGKIRFMPDVMATYRVHRAGMWGWRDREVTTRQFREVVSICKSHFAPRANAQFSRTLADIDLALCFFMFENGQYDEFRRNYPKCISHARKTSKLVAASLVLKFFVSRSSILRSAYRSFLFRWRGRNWDPSGE